MPNRNVVDRVLLGIVIALAALPFSQVFLVRLGGVALTAFEILYLAIIFLVPFKVLTDGRLTRTGLPFLLFSAAVGVHFLVSIFLYGRPAIDVVNHLRDYLPFFAATILLAVGTSEKAETYLRALIAAAVAGSAAALVIHHLMPGLLIRMLPPTSDVVILTTVYGRLHWMNAGLVLFVVLAALVPQKQIYVNKGLIGAGLLLTTAGLVNTINRTLVAAVVLLLGGYVLGEKRLAPVLRRSRKALAVGAVAAAIVLALVSVFPKVNTLIKDRYFGSGAGYVRLLEAGVVGERVPIYGQYGRSVIEYFPLGQGLGIPFHIRPDGKGVFTSDVSFVSFLLPFGLVGLILFVVFVYALFGLTSKAREHFAEGTIRIVRLFLIAAVVASLNLDLFARNNFAVFAAMLVLTLQNGRAVPEDERDDRLPESPDGTPRSLPEVQSEASSGLPEIQSEGLPGTLDNRAPQ